MPEDEYVLRTTSFDTGETVETELNQTEGAVYPEEFMAGMQEEVLKKVAEFSGVEVPLYFDNGVDERTLVGTASIEPDGEVLFHVGVDVEEVWLKRRTY